MIQAESLGRIRVEAAGSSGAIRGENPGTRQADNVKEQVVAERGFENFVLRCEHVAEIEYQPGKCNRPYRLIICRKTIDVEVGQEKALGRVSLLLLHHQRPQRRRRKSWCCKPTDAATRRT